MRLIRILSKESKSNFGVQQLRVLTSSLTILLPIYTLSPISHFFIHIFHISQTLFLLLFLHLRFKAHSPQSKMQTRGPRKRANAEPIVLNPKKQRVVLGVLPNFQNENVSENQSNGKLQTRRNSKGKKSASATVVYFFENFNLDKPVQRKNNAKHEIQQIVEPYAYDISNYLCHMEVNFYSFYGFDLFTILWLLQSKIKREIR